MSEAAQNEAPERDPYSATRIKQIISQMISAGILVEEDIDGVPHISKGPNFPGKDSSHA